MNRAFISNSQQRPHLTNKQRLPKCFKDTEKVIKVVKSCESNFKTALANSRFRGSHLKKVYSLTLNVLKHYDYIQKIIDSLQLMEKEKMLRREIASILIYEILFGTGNLPGESKPVLTIQGYKEDIIRVNEELNNKQVSTVKEFNLPRYARVHTLVTTVPYVVKDLENCGFQQVTYPEDISEEKYIELIGALEQKCFAIDLHFKDLLVFASYENLTLLELHMNGHIFLQDKSSCIPVHALNPEPGSAVIDGCAAPGIKSMHIAAKMKNKGVLIACEQDKSRFKTLKEMLGFGAVKISKMLCKDFRLIDPNDQAFCSVDYILLDPSCSGSGMVSRMDEVTDDKDSKTTDRLKKLAGLQIVLLKHALKFPSVKRVVYSTCSIYEWENEYVVHEALYAFSYKFKLVPVMPEWSERGLETYEHGKLCLRTVPEKHLTNGFFVAAFERLDDGETNDVESNYTDRKKKKRKCDNAETLSKKRMRREGVEKGIDIDESSRQYFKDGEINDTSCNYIESKIKRANCNDDSTSVKKISNKNRNYEGSEFDESFGQHLNDSEIKNGNSDNTSLSIDKRKKKDKKFEEKGIAENSEHHLNDVSCVYQVKKINENCEDVSTSIKKKKKKDRYCEEKYIVENSGQHFNYSKINDESSECKGNKMKNEKFDDASVFIKKSKKKRHEGKHKIEIVNDEVKDVISKYKEDKIKYEGNTENCDNNLIFSKKEKKKHKKMVEKDMVEILDLNDSKNSNLGFKYKESKMKSEGSIGNCDNASKSIKQEIKKHKKVNANNQAWRHFDSDSNVQESYQFQTMIPENELKSGITILSSHKKKHKDKASRNENKYEHNGKTQENVPEVSHKKSEKREHEKLNTKSSENKGKNIQESNCIPYKNDHFVENSTKKRKKKNSLDDGILQFYNFTK